MLETLKGLDTFLSVLKNLLGFKETLDKHQYELITVLDKAIRNTEDAILKLKDGENTIPDLETKIAHQWVEASALLRNDDRQFALQLYQKGQAWINAKDWGNYDLAIVNRGLIDAYVQKIILSDN